MEEIGDGTPVSLGFIALPDTSSPHSFVTHMEVEKSSNKDATRNKCHASSNKCLTSSNKKLLVTSATLVVTGALLVVTRSY